MSVSDSAAFYTLRKNEEFTAFLDRDKPKNEEEVKTLVTMILQQFEKNEAICWVISPLGNDDFMGTISFWKIDKAHYRAEIGYGIHPDFQQQGYMSEVLPVVIEYGFRKMNLHSIEANINPNNLGSIRLVEKHGFVQEAYFKENYYYNGKFLDSAIFSLIDKH
jgi:ribosomal-protein-alanine N-acetyltransferase